MVVPFFLNKKHKQHYRDRRRERYLDELEAMNVISFHSLDTEEFCGEEILIDHSEDVAEQVAHKMMIEKLTAVLPLLTDDERELIQAIYFDEMTEREYCDSMDSTRFDSTTCDTPVQPSCFPTVRT